jgi:hypothetical protein
MKHRVFLVAFALLCWNSSASAQQTFSRALGTERIEDIVREVTYAVVDEHRLRSNRRIVVQQSYLSQVVQRVSQVETGRPAAARQGLVRLYRTFAINLVQFAVTTTARRRTVTLNVEILNRYMAQARRRCGEAPCYMSCDPCNRRCNSCSR